MWRHNICNGGITFAAFANMWVGITFATFATLANKCGDLTIPAQFLYGASTILHVNYLFASFVIKQAFLYDSNKLPSVSCNCYIKKQTSVCIRWDILKCSMSLLHGAYNATLLHGAYKLSWEVTGCHCCHRHDWWRLTTLLASFPIVYFLFVVCSLWLFVVTTITCCS